MFLSDDIKSNIVKHENKIAFVFLCIFAAFAFYLRTLNIDTLISPGYSVVNLVGNDPWYSIRQIELLVNNGFQYSYFDPYTFYPYGDTIHWGPVFPIVCGAVSVLCGAVSTYDISYWSSFVPPLFAAAIVFIVYGIVKKLTGNTIVALVSAFLSGIIYGQYYYRSVFGFIDHHVAEVFFGSLFILAYIYLIQKNYESNKKVYVVFCIGAGLVYTLGLYNIPTMVIFAGIVTLFTFAWCVYTYLCVDDIGETIKYLHTLALVFVVPLVVMLILGYTSDLLLNRYSFGHILVYSIVCCLIPIICATLIDCCEKNVLGKYIDGGRKTNSLELKRWHLFGIMVCFIVGCIVILYISGNNFINYLFLALNDFFGNTSYTNTVSEARAWTYLEMVTEYGIGLFVAVTGFVLMLIEIIRSKKSEWLLVALWCFVMFYSTLKHIRYDYYLVVNVCVLMGVALYIVSRELNIDTIVKWMSREESIGGKKPIRKNKQDLRIATKSKKNIAKYKNKNEEVFKKDKNIYYKNYSMNLFKIISTVIFCILIISFAFTSASVVMNHGSQIGGGIDEGRYGCMMWLNNNTPGVGIDYYSIYDKETFVYPEESYGVASWWDYGHWITSVAHRIPVANPFQHGVSGIDSNGTANRKIGVAGLFVTPNEDEAVSIVEDLDVKYIFTDYQMASDKFWAMATWYDANTSGDYVMNMPYYEGLVQKGVVRLYNDCFYDSMAVRLHNYDGGYRPVHITGYVRIANDLGGVYDYGETTMAEIVNEIDAGKNIYTAGLNPYNTTHDVESLEHFRLVYESEQFSVNNGDTKIAFAKVFEYVKGAKINMTMGGTMYIPVKTNTGRQFVYVQNSDSGEFVVPYSTDGCEYDTGIISNESVYIQTWDGKTYKVNVDEDEVLNGCIVGMDRMISV